MRVFLAMVIAAVVLTAAFFVSQQPWADDTHYMGYVITAIISTIVGSAVSGVAASLQVARRPPAPSRTVAPAATTYPEYESVVSGPYPNKAPLEMIARTLAVVALLLIYAALSLFVGMGLFGGVPFDGVRGEESIQAVGVSPFIGWFLLAAVVMWNGVALLFGWFIGMAADDDDGGIIVGAIACAIIFWVTATLPIWT